MTTDSSINQLLNVLSSLLEPWIKVSARLSNVAYDMLSDESIGILGEVLEDIGVKAKKKDDDTVTNIAKRIRNLAVAQKYTTVQEVCNIIKKGKVPELAIFASRIENLLDAKQYEKIHTLCNDLIED